MQRFFLSTPQKVYSSFPFELWFLVFFCVFNCLFVFYCFCSRIFVKKTKLAKNKPLHKQTPYHAPRALPLMKRCFYLQNRPGLHVVNWLLRFCQNWRILSSSLVMMVSSDERLNTCWSVSKDISKAPRSLICHNVCLHKDQKDRTPCTASSKVSLDRCWCICIRMWPYVVMNELNHYKSSSCCPAHLHILDTPRTYQRPSLCAHGVQREFPKL